jgi:predicted pyridoxine 5'-phosphate oxidase superfamily flavin-nucleotide-binding protein
METLRGRGGTEVDKALKFRPYHDGEREVQRRAGVGDLALRTAKVIRPEIPSAAREFLLEQPMAVAASVGADGGVWASLLTGEPGFLAAVDERTVRVGVSPAPGDPLADDLGDGAPVGLLAIDLSNRRRMKAKGTARLLPGGGFELRTERVYALCPKYIQAREWELRDDAGEGRARGPERGEVLTPRQRRWISRADTFFVATFHPETGADASHRGGFPGFVEVLDERTLAWPDYRGNRMFNTLGNLAENPRAGLLFVDFETGDTLQLAGEASVAWCEGRVAPRPGAERAVRFRVHQVLETPAAGKLRWRFREYSPFNPA